MTTTTREQDLTAMLLGYERMRDNINLQMENIQVQLGQRQATETSTVEISSAHPQANGRRKMSAAARRKIQEAQKARWAAYHEAKEKEARAEAKALKAAAKPTTKAKAKRRKARVQVRRQTSSLSSSTSALIPELATA